MELKFMVPGTPKALKRHRDFIRNGVHGHYDPSAQDKRTFLDLAFEHKPEAPISEPIEIYIYFYFPYTKSHYRTGKNAAILKQNSPTFVNVKPDLDNLEKYVLDALNGVFWRDDSLIVKKYAEKIYTTETPRTTILIKTL